MNIADRVLTTYKCAFGVGEKFQEAAKDHHNAVCDLKEAMKELDHAVSEIVDDS